MTEQTRRTWAEIHLDRLERNYHKLRALAPESKFAGLVKSNAYGHGAVPVAKKLEELGADYLLVACLDEAEELRQAGIHAPILILGYTPVEYAGELLEYGITQTVYDPEQAKALSDAALARGKRLRCHLKADTGMSRLGVLCDEAHLEQGAETLAEMARLPGLEAEGLFMHFADADTCPEYSRMQIDRYRRLLALLEKAATMEDIISLENALSETEYQIEQYTSDLKRYDSLIDFATIELRLTEVARISDEPGEVAPLGARVASAFGEGLHSFGDGLGNLAVWLAYHAVGVAALLAVLMGAGLAVRRRLRKRGAVHAPPDAQTEETEGR